MNENILSPRGQIATITELRVDMNLFFQANRDLWHKKKNPNGKFPLNLAENNLCWDLMQRKMEDILSSQSIPKWVTNYTGLVGHSSFLESVAKFMSKHVSGCTIDHTYIAASSGSTAVVELCAWILCSPGDVVMMPAPCYPVYTQDIKMKAAAERYDINTHHDIEQIKTGSILNSGHLETAVRSLNQQGKVVRMLLLTNPDNPTGIVYSKKQITEIATWCIKNKIHLVVNELYALSSVNIDDSDLSTAYDPAFETVSIAKLIENMDSTYLHMIYGFSKDFGISGMRVGIMYSKNELFLQAFKNLNTPHMVSNLTQWLVQEVLSDKKFIKNYIKENKKRLTASYKVVTQMLDSIAVPYVNARGSLFVWLDLSELLAEKTPEAENTLWRSLYDDYGVLLTPGTGFGHSKLGQFRLVHTFLQEKPLVKAMKQIKQFVLKKREEISA